MRHKKLFISIVSFYAVLNAQDLSSDRAIIFPDLDNHLTLVCDLHTHSVFSDGSVWPDIRVEEAEKDKIDVLAITEHLEYQPHISDIPHPDRNRSYELADKYSDDDLLIVSGVELTRRMPLGHCNAIFIEDANKLLHEDDMKAFEEANRQKAFVFWNHPYRKQEPYGNVEVKDVHKELFDKGYIHGIEVVNKFKYSDESLQVALDYNLTIVGNSDIHGLVDWEYEVPAGGHRPVTLVFAKDKTKKAIKKALFNRQTVVWNNNTLIGREKWLLPLIDASLEVVSLEYKTDVSEYKRDLAYVTIKNHSDVRFVLKNKSKFNFFMDSDLIEIPANGSIELEVITKGKLNMFNLSFEVQNAIFAPRKHPIITLKIK